MDDGPFFEDLHLGWSYRSPGHTITPGHAAWFLAFAGDQNRTHLDASSVGLEASGSSPVNTALVAHLAIGQSTRATREVVANLYYRDVRFLRPVGVGSTLVTVVSVAARERATRRDDRPPRGKVLLRMETYDESGRLVLHMERLALVRARHHARDTAEDGPGVERPARSDAEVAASTWLAELGTPSLEGTFDWDTGLTRDDHLTEPVVDPLGLVRLTGNEARAHREAARGQQSRRLVYGGHTVSLAQAGLSRMVGCAYVVLAWHRCEHPSPVFENDELVTSATLVSKRAIEGGQLAVIHVETCVSNREVDKPVQRWRLETLTP